VSRRRKITTGSRADRAARGILQAVGFTALGLLVLGWLVVSFQSPGRGRRLTSRLAAAVMTSPSPASSRTSSS
jgi:hypothetical protein